MWKPAKQPNQVQPLVQHNINCTTHINTCKHMFLEDCFVTRQCIISTHLPIVATIYKLVTPVINFGVVKSLTILLSVMSCFHLISLAIYGSVTQTGLLGSSFQSYQYLKPHTLTNTAHCLVLKVWRAILKKNNWLLRLNPRLANTDAWHQLSLIPGDQIWQNCKWDSIIKSSGWTQSTFSLQNRLPNHTKYKSHHENKTNTKGFNKATQKWPEIAPLHTRVQILKR